MSDNIAVMPGPGQVDLPLLRSVASEFGWTVKIAHGPREITAVDVRKRASVVLFHRETFGSGYSWGETIHRLKQELPAARLIACHGFAESVDWPALSEAGAFHSLWLPMKESEVRRSLGFVWEVNRRSRESASDLREPVPIPNDDAMRFNRASDFRARDVRSMVGAAV